MKNNSMEVKLSNLIKAYWDEDSETCRAYADLLIDHMSYSQAEYLIKNDSYFNRYSDVSNYTELINEIVSDDAFFDDEYNDYIDDLVELDKRAENEKEEALRKDGWVVGFGVAIGVCEKEIKEISYVL